MGFMFMHFTASKWNVDNGRMYVTLHKFHIHSPHCSHV